MKTLKTKKFLEQSRMTEKHNQEMRAFYTDASDPMFCLDVWF